CNHGAVARITLEGESTLIVFSYQATPATSMRSIKPTSNRVRLAFVGLFPCGELDPPIAVQLQCPSDHATHPFWPADALIAAVRLTCDGIGRFRPRCFIQRHMSNQAFLEKIG